METNTGNKNLITEVLSSFKIFLQKLLHTLKTCCKSKSGSEKL